MTPAESEQIEQQLRRQAQQLGLLPSPAALAVKRLLDFLFAFFGLLLCGPLILLLALLIKWDSPGPALFRQARLGRWGRPFILYKLRTMIPEAERQGAGLAIEKDDPRITRLGAILRRLSLDELPQLWNVLRGEMSLVGPRPLPVAYLERWNERQRLRLVMPQGITGWSQLTLRNEGSWPERLEKDIEYVQHWSLLFDARIFLGTIGQVLRRRGIESTQGGVPEYTGPEGERGEGAEVLPPREGQAEIGLHEDEC